jgi:hypothetical protein
MPLRRGAVRSERRAGVADRLQLLNLPTDANGLWAHVDPDRAAVSCEQDATAAYVWGDKTLALHHCRTCGCVTHWTPLDPTLRRMAVNCRMAAPEDIASIRVRHFDGADTWAFLD